MIVLVSILMVELSDNAPTVYAIKTTWTYVLTVCRLRNIIYFKTQAPRRCLMGDSSFSRLVLSGLISSI